MTTSEGLNQALREWVHVFVRRSMHESIRSMKDSGRSMSHLHTFMRLAKHGPVSISSISEMLDISLAAASQMVDRLVNDGMLARTEDPDDRRAKLINLTPEGQQLVEDVYEARLAWMKDLANELSPDDQAKIASALTSLTQAAVKLESKSELLKATSHNG